MPKTKKRSIKNQTRTRGWKIALLTIPALVLFFLTVTNFLPRWRVRSQVPKKPQGENELSYLAKPSDEHEQIFLTADTALAELRTLLKELDSQIYRFERDRRKGTYGSRSQDVLVKYWRQWSERFTQKFDSAAAEFEITVSGENPDLATPLHQAFREVRRLPWVVEQVWAENSSLENLAARNGVDHAIEAARTWIENRGK